MWHVETDVFALMVFLIMFIKEFGLRSMRKQRELKDISDRDIQSDAFYFVLVFSIVSVLIDIVSSLAKNHATNWWVYQILMTLYVASMPLWAVVWVGYAYVLVHPGYSGKTLMQRTSLISIPYVIYIFVALSNPFTGLFFRLSSSMEYERGI